MTATVFTPSNSNVAVNPNFTGPGGKQVLLARDLLVEEFSNHGIVTDAIEEHLAANREQAAGVALMRSWEERAWRQMPDDSETCMRCGVDKPVMENGKQIGLIKHYKTKGAPHPEWEAYPYFDRRAHYDRLSLPKKTIDMAPEVATDRIDLLMRSGRPSEHAREINELRTNVLGLPAIDFAEDPVETPIVTQGMTSAKAEADSEKETVAPKAPPKAPLDEKRENFLRMDFREQRIAVQDETSLDFLNWVLRNAPVKKVIPVVRTAAKKRLAALQQEKE